MPRPVTPRIFLLYETRRVEDVTYGYHAFLRHLGVSDWRTDAMSDSEEAVEVAGKLCYLSFSTELNKNLTRVGTRDNLHYIQEQLVQVQHGSVLEHPTCTFAFMDVSRILTHELVRHRPGAAYSQVSGRYVRSDELTYYLPSDLANDPDQWGEEWLSESFRIMEERAKAFAEHYQLDQMKDFGRKKRLTSIQRRAVGNGQGNHIIASYNHRALRHLIEARTNPGAEEEIRVAFFRVYTIVKERYPAIYHDATVEIDKDLGLPFVTFGTKKV